MTLEQDTLAAAAEAAEGLAEETPSQVDGDAAPETLDAQAADETPDSASADDGPVEEDQEELTPAGRSRKLQKLIDSKGGDEDKFADSIYESYNSASKLSKRVDELEQRLRQVVEPPIPEPQVDEHPDVVGFQQELHALDVEANDLEVKKNGILIDLGKLGRDIAFLQGQIAKAEDYEKALLEQKRFHMEQSVRALENDYRNLERLSPRLAREKREVARQLDIAKRQISAFRDQQKAQAIEASAYQDKFRQRFESTVTEHAKKYNIPAESVEFLLDVAKAKASVFLRTLDPNSPGLDDDGDLETYIENIVGTYARDRGIAQKAKFQKLTSNKLASTTVAPRVAPPKGVQGMVDPPKTNKEAKSAEFWRQRASKILGA